MNEKIKHLRRVFDELIEREIYKESYIEVLDQEELVLSANEEGFLYLVDKILELCEKKSEYEHFHLDEAGMADMCEKSIVIKYKKHCW